MVYGVEEQGLQNNELELRQAERNVEKEAKIQTAVNDVEAAGHFLQGSYFDVLKFPMEQDC